MLKKYKELWGDIKNEIETINSGKEGKYGKHFMKIELNTNDDLPLNKLLKLPMLTIVARPIFEKVSKFYPQNYLDECLYEL